MVARSVRLLPAHMREDVHVTRHCCIVNDAMVNAMPNMQKTLLQFTTLVYIKSSAIYKECLTGI